MPEERDVVLQNPLQDILATIRDTLCKAFPFPGNNSNDSFSLKGASYLTTNAKQRRHFVQYFQDCRTLAIFASRKFFVHSTPLTLLPHYTQTEDALQVHVPQAMTLPNFSLLYWCIDAHSHRRDGSMSCCNASSCKCDR